MIDTCRIALTPAEMRVLQSMGMAIGDASMVYRRMPGCSASALMVNDPRISRVEIGADPREEGGFLAGVYGRDIPAYTTDDILRRLPRTITRDGKTLSLCLAKDDTGIDYYEAGYYAFCDETEDEEDADKVNIWFMAAYPLGALYSLLLWCLNEGCLKSDLQIECEIKQN